MVLAFKKLSLVGRFKASTQISMFYDTGYEAATGDEVGWELQGLRGRTNNKSKVRYQQGTCQWPWNHTIWPTPSAGMALKTTVWRTGCAYSEGVSTAGMLSGCPECSVSQRGTNVAALRSSMSRGHTSQQASGAWLLDNWRHQAAFGRVRSLVI